MLPHLPKPSEHLRLKQSTQPEIRQHWPIRIPPETQSLPALHTNNMAHHSGGLNSKIIEQIERSLMITDSDTSIYDSNTDSDSGHFHDHEEYVPSDDPSHGYTGMYK